MYTQIASVRVDVCLELFLELHNFTCTHTHTLNLLYERTHTHSVALK